LLYIVLRPHSKMTPKERFETIDSSPN